MKTIVHRKSFVDTQTLNLPFNLFQRARAQDAEMTVRKSGLEPNRPRPICVQQTNQQLDYYSRSEIKV